MNDTLKQLSNAVYEGQAKDIAGLTNGALAAGLSPQDILHSGLIQGMQVIGKEFKEGKKFIPEVLCAARAMQVSLGILRPLLVQTGVKMVGKVVIGTVKGDLHDIGKSLVGMMLEGAGFEVIDLGKDVGPERFVEAIKSEKPQIVALSALLTTTMRAMGRTIELLKEVGLREQVRVMVGGAPVTSDFASHINADAYGASAPDAVEIAKKFVGAT